MPCKRWAVTLRPSRRMSGLVARWQTFGRQHHPGAVDLSADSGRRVPLRSRQAVAVDPQRDRRVGVAQAGAHDVDRDPANNASVTLTWRKSCSRMAGSFARPTARSNARLTVAGATARPPRS